MKRNRRARPRKDRSKFQRFARLTARASGSPVAFGLALVVLLAWAVSGPIFHFSDTWQLIINTGTTIVTFLMVFLIQSTQNRDSEALQIKLDELLRATPGCHNAVMDIEELSENELDELKCVYGRLAKKAIRDAREGRSDCGTPAIEREERTAHHSP